MSAEPSPAAHPLAYQSIPGTATLDLTIENLHQLQYAADFQGGRKSLRKSGAWTIVWGAICIAIGIPSLRLTILNAGLVALGVYLVAVGVWNVVAPRPIGMIFDGIGFLLSGMWNIGIAILNAIAIARAPSSSGSPTRTFVPILALFQIAWGAQRLVRYSRYANASQPPPEEVTTWLDSLVTALAKAKPAEDPQVITWTSTGFSNQQIWRARLLPDVALCLLPTTHDIRFLPREQFTIRPLKKVLIGKTMKMAVTLSDSKERKGTISPENLARYETWMRQVSSATPSANSDSTSAAD